MKKIFLPVFILLLANTCFSQVKSAITHSVITFHIKNMGINTGGNIGGLEAQIQFSPADLPASKIDASVATSTLNTDDDSRDNHIKSEDYFDVAHFPKISLNSVSFKHKSGSNYTGLFNLTIKGKTKQIELPFSYNEKPNSATLKGSFTINRLDFGIGDSSIILANEVTVNIEAEISR